MDDTSRAEHLTWAKQRALAYIEGERPDVRQAFQSFASDLNKRNDPRWTDELVIGMERLISRRIGTPETMRKFIENFQ